MSVSPINPNRVSSPTAVSGAGTGGGAVEADVNPTSYYPHNDPLEGGVLDEKGHPLRGHTLQEYLRMSPADQKNNYVAVAMDGNMPYGTPMRVPELEQKMNHGNPINFKVVDNGGAFNGKGLRRMDICSETKSDTTNPLLNQTDRPKLGLSPSLHVIFPNGIKGGPVSSTGGASSTGALSKGANDPAVQTLQTKLNKLGYDCGKADGDFGSKTDAAVRKFQADNKLPADGVAGKDTLAALNKAIKAKAAEGRHSGDFGGTTAKPAPAPSATPAPAGATRWTAAPSMADLTANRAALHEGQQGESVKALQTALGFTGADVDGKFGPRTKAAVAAFQQANGLTPPKGMEGMAGKTTLDALHSSSPHTATRTPAGSSSAVVGPNATVDTNNPTLQKLANGRLHNGPTYYCVATTLANMQRLGVPQPAATGEDTGSNPRGGMVQMVRNFGWKSLPLPGAKVETIRSPAYGTIQANVVPADEYEKLANAGKIPSGAIIFQTRHDSWNANSEGSHGFDMGIVRDGGRQTFNYQANGPLVYSSAKSVVILVPGDALKSH